MEVYLDNCASTKPYDEVVEVANKYFTELWQNPSSLYYPSTQIKADIEDARKVVADFINAKPNEIVFTSGGSESNCLALQGWAKRRLIDGGDPCIVTTFIEHKSIFECINNTPYVRDCFMRVDPNGFVDLETVKSRIEMLISSGHEPKDILFSIQHVQNELGVIQPIKDIAKMVHSYGCLIHTDAVQSVPHINVDVDYLGVDMLSASAHKFHGLKGNGFLYVKNGVWIDPIITGSQEYGMRGGTENVAGIMAMSKALEVLKSKNYCRLGIIRQLYYGREYFVDKLKKIGCTVNTKDGTTIPTCINVKLPGVSGEALMYMLDTAGIQVSTGSACNSKSIEPSHVLKAIGLTDEEAAQCIRISFSEDISVAEIDYCVEEMERSIKLLRGETIDAKMLDAKY